MPNSPANLPREQQYAALVNVRNTELAAYWTRYNIQAVLNLGLTVATLSSKPDSFIGRNVIFAAAVGIILALIWLFFTIYGKRLFTERWERHIVRYEQAFLPREHRLFANVLFEEDAKGWFRKHWCNLNILARSIPTLLLLVWIIVGIVTFRQLKSSLKEHDLSNLNNKAGKLINQTDIETTRIGLDCLMLDANDMQSYLHGTREASGSHTVV
jgi:hypothetical protein